MMKHARALWVLIVVSTLWLAGCGTSGSQPVIQPEVIFAVQANEESVFTAELEVGGVAHRFPDPASADGLLHFNSTSIFHFLVENGAPPYGGRFTLVSGGNISVSWSVTGQTSQTVGPDSAAVVGTFSGNLPLPAQEVRFDVCVPSLTSDTCFTEGDSGFQGLTFQGTLGDSAQTHLLNTSVPSIFFLENAVDSVNGIFTLNPFTGQNLLAQLFINGVLKQSQAGMRNVIVQQDL